MEQMIECYALCTPVFDLSKRKYRKGAHQLSDKIAKMEGFLAVDTSHLEDAGIVWIFDSENNAKIAMNRIRGEGIPTGQCVGKCNMPKDEYDRLMKKGVENEICKENQENN